MDPQVQALFDMMEAQAAAAGAPPMWELPADVARANAETGFAAFNAGAPELASVVDTTIPGPAGQIPVKILTPKGEGPFPLLVYLHGGGWVIGSPATHEKLCAELADGAGVVVVSVDYRLAPEHPAPAALEDCVAAIRWSVENAPTINADPSRFAIGGDSAGANLAAAAALQLRDSAGPQASLLLLIYGCYDLAFETQSCVENGEGKILTLQSMHWFRQHYLSNGADLRDPLISPIHANLGGLPPAHLIVGSLDPLLDDSRLFASKLEAADVPTRLSVYEDMPHVFLQLSAFLDGGKKGVAEAVEALSGALR